MFVKKGVPKSLYRPGSSTDILIFQKNRIHFAEDILRNRLHGEAQSRFTLGFGVSLVETDIKVRSLLGLSLLSPSQTKRSTSDLFHPKHVLIKKPP
jgi:phosphatidylserine decarboxylase